MSDDLGEFDRLVGLVNAVYVARSEDHGGAFEQPADQPAV
jgi:hypothetical protein